MGRVARQASINTALTYGGLALGFLNLVVLYPAYLPTDQFGLTRLVVSIAAIAAQVAQMGGESTMIRYFPYFRDKANGHHGILGLAVAVGTCGALCVMLVLWVFHDRFASWFNDQSGLYGTYGLVVLPLVLSEVYFLLFRGYSRSVHRSIAPTFTREFLLRVLQTALILLHWAFDLPFALFMAVYTLTFLMGTLALVWDLWRADELRFGFGKLRLPRRLRKSMSRYGLFTFGSGMATITIGNLDQLMIGVMLPEALDHVAYYAVAFYIASVIMVPARALVLPMLPILADAWKRRDMVHITMIYHRTAAIQFVIAAYLFLCLWAGSEVLFGLMRPEFIVGRNVMLVLAFTNVLNLSTGLSGGIVATSRSYWFDAVSGFAMLMCNLVFDYVFILRWGMIGAGWSSLASVVLVMGWRLAFLYRAHGLWPYDRRSAVAFGAALASWGLLLVLPTIGGLWTDAVVRVTAITIVYWPVIYLFRVTPELGSQLGKVFRSFKIGRRTDHP